MQPTLNRIVPPSVRLYSPTSYLGEVNEYELNDFRIQIAAAKATGYYVIDPDGARHNLDKNGRFETYPECLDLMTKQLTELLMP